MKAAHAASEPHTVYRSLEFLLANGFVHKLDSINAYIVCHHPRAAQHSVPFLICDRCHHAVELEDEQVVDLLHKSARELGFHAQAQTLEVHGLCADRSEEHTSELQSLMRISYAVFCLNKKTKSDPHNHLN